MSKESTENKVREIVAEQLAIGDDELSADAHFVSELGADRLDVIELIMAFEEEFDLDISDEDAEGLCTIQSVVDYIEQKSQ
ncbi:MAG: acyl carrier protein [Pseudomonadota bacterium]